MTPCGMRTYSSPRKHGTLAALIVAVLLFSNVEPLHSREQTPVEVVSESHGSQALQSKRAFGLDLFYQMMNMYSSHKNEDFEPDNGMTPATSSETQEETQVETESPAPDESSATAIPQSESFAAEAATEEVDDAIVELVELTTSDFDEQVNGHRQALLLFCTEAERVCPPVEDEFDELAKLVAADKHLQRRTVIAYIDTEYSPEIAQRYHIRGHPSIRYIGWGRELNYLGAIALRYSKTAEEMHDFLLDHLEDELYIFRTRIMDRFAHDFMFSPTEYERLRIFQHAKKEALGLQTARDKESARLYLLTMRDSNLEGWYGFTAMEKRFNQTRERLESEDMDDEARWELEKRLSVMSAFVTQVQAQRHKKFAHRVAKHWMQTGTGSRNDEL